VRVPSRSRAKQMVGKPLAAIVMGALWRFEDWVVRHDQRLRLFLYAC
jgi:hypothetical protein